MSGSGSNKRNSRSQRSNLSSVSKSTRSKRSFSLAEFQPVGSPPTKRSKASDEAFLEEVAQELSQVLQGLEENKGAMENILKTTIEKIQIPGDQNGVKDVEETGISKEVNALRRLLVLVIQKTTEQHETRVSRFSFAS
jgi:hypothetical protein